MRGTGVNEVFSLQRSRRKLSGEARDGWLSVCVSTVGEDDMQLVILDCIVGPPHTIQGKWDQSRHERMRGKKKRTSEPTHDMNSQRKFYAVKHPFKQEKGLTGQLVRSSSSFRSQQGENTYLKSK